MLFLNFFGLISAQKNRENRVKISLFKGRFENHVIDLKPVKNDRF
jgi:hypothetical protein